MCKSQKLIACIASSHSY